MTVKVGINGFGRIGRNVLRAIVESGRTDIEVIAINDLGPVETNAHLLRYDSVHGRFPAEVKVDGETIDVGRGPIRVTAERDPAKLPWKDVDIALECTGIFTSAEKAALHLQNGSKKVLVSAPVSGDAPRPVRTVVYGVNHETPDGRRHRRLERLVHDELPRPRGQGDARQFRHREGLHDDHPRLYGRPADARHDAQGPLPRPRRRDVDDPDLDGRRQGRRPRPARAEGQARRLGHPRADAERLGSGPEVRRRQEGRRRGGQRRRRARRGRRS